MNREAKVIWASLEFRKPQMLFLVEPLSREQMHWIPPNEKNSIAWQVWHIAEVEDNWVRHILLEEERQYPFGCSLRTADRDHRLGSENLRLTFGW